MRLFFSWAAVAAWCGVIFYFSGIPDFPMGVGGRNFFLRKTAHFVEYAFLAVLLWRAFRASGMNDRRKIFWAVVSFGLVYAVSDEIHQYFVPGRSCKIRDVAIDGASAFFMGWIQRVLGDDIFSFALSRWRKP